MTDGEFDLTNVRLTAVAIRAGDAGRPGLSP